MNSIPLEFQDLVPQERGCDVIEFVGVQDMFTPHRQQEIDRETTGCLQILDLILARGEIKRLLLENISPDLTTCQVELHAADLGPSG